MKMTRALMLMAALLAVLAVAMGFGWLHTVWFAYAPEGARDVLLAYAAAATAVAVLFLAGQLLRIRGHAYDVIVGGLAFLAVDAAVWWRFGIMPGPKSYQDGFVPAAIMGVFLGPLYRIIAPGPR
jgi:hypothetical protein